MKGHIFAKCRIFSTAVFASALLGGGLSSCTTFDDSELKNSIDNLEDRVEALEDFRDQVQSDIVSLQEIIEKLQSSVTVDNIVEATTAIPSISPTVRKSLQALRPDGRPIL